MIGLQSLKLLIRKPRMRIGHENIIIQQHKIKVHLLHVVISGRAASEVVPGQSSFSVHVR